MAVYGAAAHQEKKGEERLGDSPVLGSALQGFALEPYLHTVPGSLLCREPVGCLVSNYILCLLQISLGLEPFFKNSGYLNSKVRLCTERGLFLYP